MNLQLFMILDRWKSLLYGESQILESVFLRILDTGISAVYLIAAVIFVRFLFRNSTYNIRFVLWLLVEIRLILPYSIESVLSLVPKRQHMAILHSGSIQIDTGIPVINESVSKYLQQYTLPVTSSANSPLAFIIYVCARVWIFGMILMAGYLVCSWWNLKRKLRTAVPQKIECRGNDVKVYRSDQIDSPFLFGLFHPKIYLPYSVAEQNLSYVIMHELMHKKRRDYLLKPAGFLVLACYWFHPLVWIAYIFMCRDMEFACDEAVIQSLGVECKKEYSQALLLCSARDKNIAACPVAFGETGVKERIQSILNYKKPAKWGIAAAAIVCAAVAVCFMTQKKEKTDVAAQGNIQKENSYESMNTENDDLEETPLQNLAEGTVNIRDYFPNSHYEQEHLVMEADLDKDGNPEKIILSDLGYNGGDGGYKLEVFRIKDGMEQKIQLPDGYGEEAGFAFYMEWTGKEAALYTPNGQKTSFSEEQIVDLYRSHGQEQQIKESMESGGVYSDYAADAVSGFTVAEDAKDHMPVLITKQYLMGCLGHADCFGYGVSFLKLQKDDKWETEYLYLQD